MCVKPLSPTKCGMCTALFNPQNVTFWGLLLFNIVLQATSFGDQAQGIILSQTIPAVSLCVPFSLISACLSHQTVGSKGRYMWCWPPARACPSLLWACSGLFGSPAYTTLKRNPSTKWTQVKTWPLLKMHMVTSDLTKAECHRLPPLTVILVKIFKTVLTEREQ